MRTLLAALAALALVPVSEARADPPPSRLYVRTIPPGARVVLDGRELGLSDGLFIVLPGEHSVTIELEGYSQEKRDVSVAPERITRLVVTLVKQEDEGSPSDRTAVGAEATVQFLSETDAIPATLLPAMQTVLRQHPGETRWSGREGELLFGIAVKKLPDGPVRERAMPALLSLTHSLAVQEMLKAKSLLDLYAKAGLTDATTLSRAVADVADALEVAGRVQGLTHQSGVRGDYAVAYVFASERSLTAHLLQPAEVEKVKAAYRDVMHRQARQLMEQGNYQDAILLWRHLHSRRLVSQSLYLDAATCFIKLKQPEDAMRILDEAYGQFVNTASAEWLEKFGDVACELGAPGEPLAIKAYNEASSRLRNIVTTGSPLEKGEDR